MKFGKNVFTDTKYTDGYFNIIIHRFNKTVQHVTITTPDEDVIELKSIRKLKDLSEMLLATISDYEADGTVAE